jgi:hypothetical protein
MDKPQLCQIQCRFVVDNNLPGMEVRKEAGMLNFLKVQMKLYLLQRLPVGASSIVITVYYSSVLPYSIFFFKN